MCRFYCLQVIRQRVSPIRARYFRLLAQEKAPKEKGTRRLGCQTPRAYKAATQPCPALLGKTGARATRDLATLDYAQTGRKLDPVFPAMLGCARRDPSPSTCTTLGFLQAPFFAIASPRKSVGAAEHRSYFGIERAALFELDLLAGRRGKSCEFGERPKWREAQGTCVSGQVFGTAFLLGTFLWRSQ